MTLTDAAAARLRRGMPARLMEGTVLDPPLTADGFVRLEVAGQRGRVRECPWVAAYGTEPRADDAAVVHESDRGNLWAQVWAFRPPEPPPRDPKPWEAGDLKASAVDAVPEGWLDCNGALVLIASYPDLFDAIEHSWNGGADPGGGTFKVPDLRGRVIVGAGTGTGLTARALADGFGAETHRLTISEAPSHDHGGATGTPTGYPNTNVYAAGGGTNFVVHTWGGAFIGSDVGKYADLVHRHSITAQGGGGTHNNVQPSRVVKMLVKT